MKGLPATLLALVFAFLSLLSLLMTPQDSDRQDSALAGQLREGF